MLGADLLARELDDLAHVIGVVAELAQDGLDDGVVLAAGMSVVLLLVAARLHLVIREVRNAADAELRRSLI